MTGLWCEHALSASASTVELPVFGLSCVSIFLLATHLMESDEKWKDWGVEDNHENHNLIHFHWILFYHFLCNFAMEGNLFRESSHWHASLETPGLMEISTYCLYAGVNREYDIPWSKHSSCGLISGQLISCFDFLLLLNGEILSFKIPSNVFCAKTFKESF